MPKIEPYGTPAMKAAAMARKNEKKRIERLLFSLDVLKRKLNIRSDAKFAEAIGFTYSRYKRIKERPERLTIDEVWLLFEAAAQYKESVDFGLEVIV